MLRELCVYGSIIGDVAGRSTRSPLGQPGGQSITYCAFCEIPKRLGVIEACEPGCYSDEVFFPGFFEPFGLRFVRTQTLGRKGDRCDFRFEHTRGS